MSKIGRGTSREAGSGSRLGSGGGVREFILSEDLAKYALCVASSD